MYIVSWWDVWEGVGRVCLDRVVVACKRPVSPTLSPRTLEMSTEALEVMKAGRDGCFFWVVVVGGVEIWKLIGG